MHRAPAARRPERARALSALGPPGLCLVAGLLTGGLLAGCTDGAAAQSEGPPRGSAASPAALPAPRDYVRAPLAVDPDPGAPRQRLASLAPAVTEMCCALGLADQLVGRTSYCDYPPEIARVPSVGALTNLNVEALVRLEPDLVLVSGRSQAQRDALAGSGLRVESVPDVGLHDVFAAVRRIGELTGRTRAAEALCAALQADLDAVTARFVRVPSARVLILTATLSDPPTSPFVAGPGSFYDELLRRAGHRNAAPPTGRAFGPVALEALLRADPDVVIELDADGRSRPGGDAQARAVWSKLGPMRAVREGRVHVVTGRQHYLLGPRVAQTYLAIAAAVAGENP